MIRLDRFDNAGYSRGASPLKEGLWWVVRSTVFATTLPVPSGLKVWLLRLFGARLGKGVVVRSRVNITFPWRFRCGDHVWIGDEVCILSLSEVWLGSHVCISQRAFLCTGSHDFSRETFDLMTGTIVVGDGCWIGALAFVGPGVTFGKASRCLAGAVVVKNVSAGETVGGVPAVTVGGMQVSDEESRNQEGPLLDGDRKDSESDDVLEEALFTRNPAQDL